MILLWELLLCLFWRLSSLWLAVLSFLSTIKESSKEVKNRRKKSNLKSYSIDIKNARLQAEHFCLTGLWSIWDSNPLPFDCEPNALPDELMPRLREERQRTLSRSDNPRRKEEETKTCFCFFLLSPR